MSGIHWMIVSTLSARNPSAPASAGRAAEASVPTAPAMSGREVTNFPTAGASVSKLVPMEASAGCPELREATNPDQEEKSSCATQSTSCRTE